MLPTETDCLLFGTPPVAQNQLAKDVDETMISRTPLSYARKKVVRSCELHNVIVKSRLLVLTQNILASSQAVTSGRFYVGYGSKKGKLQELSFHTAQQA